ncbi:GvpL/GvpF family gas vesicle protein [Streptomyces sp. NPDC047022]|uniref:GvpL/GvpF family gas vesicle protein n=1 Tax=Streptomyces sp. NPDC047022 TaxID=3155737 RepID=UPI0033F43B5F
MSDAEMLYVYAVGRDDRALDRLTSLVTGVDRHALRLVGSRGLAALVSPVPADRFAEASLMAQLEDLGRLESLARAHHAVVDAAFAETTVLPMRLATVYRDEPRVAAVLDEQYTHFEKLLRLFDGHVELGVKVYAVPHAVSHAVPEQPETGPAASTPGRAYLRRRRAQRNTVRYAARAASTIAEAAARKADALATARAVHRPQQGEWSGGRGENVANESYLVPLDAVDEFRGSLSALARDEPGVGIEVTGPWAPYSFAAQAARERVNSGERE